PNTGSYVDFASTQATQVALEAGVQVVRLTFGGGDDQDFKSFTLAPVGPPPEPASIEFGVAAATTRVSTNADNAQWNDGSYQLSVSEDGRHVAAMTLAGNVVAGEQGNQSSLSPSISPDGRYVAFDSDASNLVAGDANGAQDIFRKDLQTGD